MEAEALALRMLQLAEAVGRLERETGAGAARKSGKNGGDTEPEPDGEARSYRALPYCIPLGCNKSPVPPVRR